MRSPKLSKPNQRCSKIPREKRKRISLDPPQQAARITSLPLCLMGELGGNSGIRVARDSDPIRREPVERTINGLNAIVKSTEREAAG